MAAWRVQARLDADRPRAVLTRLAGSGLPVDLVVRRSPREDEEVATRRTRPGTRSPLVVIATVLCSGAIAVPASGREGAPVAGVLIERTVTAIVTVHAGGQPPSVTEVNGFERRVDPTGRTISEGSFDVADPAMVESVGVFGCSAHGDEPGFRDHSDPLGPVRLGVDRGGSAAGSIFHISTLAGGRQVSGRPAVQVLICAAGGARAANGQRLLQAGIGAAYDDSDGTHILGKRWLDGPTPAIGEDGYGFAGAGDTGASGRIEQDPSGVLEGSLIGPFPSGFDDYFANAMAGWWEHPCHDGEACDPADGSTVFQGSLTGGLWEFYDDPARDYRFRVALFCAVVCANPFSCLQR